MLFCVAALVQFLLAGLTGVSHASAALDWQTKNSYYLVAHFHFVFVGLIVFVDPRRAPLLDPENERAHALGAARQMELLAHGRSGST